MIPVEQMKLLEGYRFPPGFYKIEHWENYLLTEATAGKKPSSTYAHPSFLFHAPLAAVGLTYQEIFDLCLAESADAVRAGEYDWEILRPLEEGIKYHAQGQILSVERKIGRQAGAFDAVVFQIELTDVGELVARITNTWLFLRTGPTPGGQSS
ncbi:MAG: hypothetical protein P8M16_04630 [Acidimicrobiales bacterium]|nr:hypothetical protein [Acidimicrobiales bacterium]